MRCKSCMRLFLTFQDVRTLAIGRKPIAAEQKFPHRPSIGLGTRTFRTSAIRSTSLAKEGQRGEQVSTTEHDGEPEISLNGTASQHGSGTRPRRSLAVRNKAAAPSQDSPSSMDGIPQDESPARTLKHEDNFKKKPAKSKGRSQITGKNSAEFKGDTKPENWKIQKAALDSKFSEGYVARKRLSPDTLPGIRMLHSSDPLTFSTPVLAEHFKVSPEAIRRILKSKWRPNEDEEEERRLRWDRRGEKIWTRLAELGTRPPKKWRTMGVGSVDRRGGEVPAWKKKKRREQEDHLRIFDDDLVDEPLPAGKPRFADRIA